MSINHITNSNPSADTLDIYVKDIRARNLIVDGIGDIITPSITTSIIKNTSDNIYSTSIPSKVQLSTVLPVGFITQLDDISYQTERIKKYNPDTSNYEEILKVKLYYRFTTPLAPANVDTQWQINLTIPNDYLNTSVIYSSSSLRTLSSATSAPYFGVRSILTDTIGIAKLIFGAPSHLDIFQSPFFNQVSVEFELNRGY